MPKAERKEYRIVDYFDVWGNAKEGYEVNNLRVYPVMARINQEAPDLKREVMRALKKAEYMKLSARMASFVLEVSDIDFIEITQRDGMPVCRLELEREGK